MELCKAVFLFPLTKSLRVQKDRIAGLSEKYISQETDDPIEAGKLLSESPGGILYCSDTKKLTLCFEKYAKLFNDSKFRVVLVIPKRIVGKELMELNKLGVQDILIEPLTEKSLTTKVEYNYQMIRKLLDAIARKAKNKAESDKADASDAARLRQRLDKLDGHEKMRKGNAGDFKDEIKEVKFKFFYGKKQLTKFEDSILTMENFTQQQEAVSNIKKALFKDAVFQSYDGKIDTSASKDDLNEKDLKLKNNTSPEETPDDDKTLNQKNEDDKLNHELKGKISIKIDTVEKTHRKNPSTEVEKDNLNNSFKSTKDETGSSLINNSDRKSSPEEKPVAMTSSNTLSELDHLIGVEGSSEIKKSHDLKHEAIKGDIEQDHLAGSLLHAQTKADDNNKLDGNLKAEIEQEEQKPKIADDVITQKEHINSHDQVDTDAQDTHLKTAKEKKITAIQEVDNFETFEKTTTKDEAALTNANIELKDDKKENISAVAPVSTTKKEGSGAVAGPEDLNNSIKDIKTTEELNDTQKSAPIALKEELELKAKSITKDETSAKEEKLKTPSQATAEVAPDMLLKKKAEELSAHENSKGSKKNDTKIDPAIEKKIVNTTAATTENRKGEFASNFVDEFTKLKPEDLAAAALAKLSPEERAKKIAHDEELNSVIFDHPPASIVSAHINGIDVGLQLLYKLSIPEQKIEQQTFVFTTIAKRIFEDLQGLVSFYVIDKQSGAILSYSSHAERSEFYNTLGLPPLEDYVKANMALWQTYRYSTLSDETLQKNLIEMVYPYGESGKTLGIAIVHCFKTLKEARDVTKLEMLLEFARGYFMRYQNVGSQGDSSKRSVEKEVEVKVTWLSKLIKQGKDWLDKNMDKGAAPEDGKKKTDESKKTTPKKSSQNKKTSTSKDAA